MGLSNKIKEKFDKKDAVDNASKAEFGDQKDFFKQIDEYIKMDCKNKSILNSLNKLYKDQEKVEIINTNPYCFEYQSDPEDKYKLSNDEVQILQDINSKLLYGIKIGDLYKTTKIVLCDAPNDSDFDLLGSYSHEEKYSHSKSFYPVVKIYMNRVEAVAKELGYGREYVTACVYVHEMMHRYYDIRPDLYWKEYVTEIEEPMAVFGAMKFCDEFYKETLLKVSRHLTEDLRKSKWYDQNNYYVYILGLEMFDKSVDAGLIETYCRVSLMMHKSSSEVEGFDNPIDSYLNICKQNRNSLDNLVEPIKEIIHKFAEFFPLDKGTE